MFETHCDRRVGRPQKNSQNLVSAFSLNCIVLGLYSNSVQGLFDVFSILFFLLTWSMLLRSASISSSFSGTSSQNIPHSPRLPGVCHQTTSPERSRFQYLKNSRCTNAEVGTVEAQGVVRQTSVSQLQFQPGMEPEHIVESVVLRSTDLLLSFSRIREFIATDTVGCKSGHSPKPHPFQLLLLIPVLVWCIAQWHIYCSQ